MKVSELVRWGIPGLGFVAYVNWGGVSLALVLAGMLFALISGFIHWHRTNPSNFFKFFRAIVVIFVLAPAVVLTLVGAFSSMLGMLAALPLLALALWLTRWAFRNAATAPLAGLPSMASQNLFAANAVRDQIHTENRRRHARSTSLHLQAENLELIQKNRALEEETNRLRAEVKRLDAALNDPFYDPA